MDPRTREMNIAAAETGREKELNESEADQVTGGVEQPGKYGPGGYYRPQNPYGPHITIGPRYHHHTPGAHNGETEG